MKKKLQDMLTNDELVYLYDEGIDIRHKQIYLNSILAEDDGDEMGVDFNMATKFTKSINLLQAVSNPEDPFLIHMNNKGGDWYFGMQIYDSLNACQNPTTMVSYAHARSMSSLIIQAADWRVMMPNAYFMFHDGTYGYEGTLKQSAADIDFYRKVTDKTMLDTYANQMVKKGEFKGKPIKEIRGWLRNQMDKKEDVFLEPHEAVELGLIDEVFTNWDDYLNKNTRCPKQPKK